VFWFTESNFSKADNSNLKYFPVLTDNALTMMGGLTWGRKWERTECVLLIRRTWFLARCWICHSDWL